MTLESLARTIAKARHGTDVMWPNYMEAAKKAAEWFAQIAERHPSKGALEIAGLVRALAFPTTGSPNVQDE